MENMIERLKKLSILELRGMIIFRESPSYRKTDPDDTEAEFKSRISDLQNKYMDLGFFLDFSGSAFKVQLETSKKHLLKSLDFADILARDLDSAFGIMPEDKYLIQVNIAGSYRRFLKKWRFTISNNKNKIGINKIIG